MNLALQEMYNDETSVSKKEFEKGYLELMDRFRIIDQKLVTKSDQMLVDKAEEQFKNINDLQEKFSTVAELVQKHQKNKIQSSVYKDKATKRRHWFKKMQLSGK